MKAGRQEAKFDWLVELGGASALALAAAFAAFKASPSFGFTPPTTTVGAAAAFFGLGFLTMRVVGSEPPVHAIADFSVDPIHADDVLELTEVVEEPLLLDTPYDELADVEALLLEDALPEPDPASRVVRLFAAQQVPTPGQLKDRIDRHLAAGTMHRVREFEGPAPDASDALFAALSELKRSLR